MRLLWNESTENISMQTLYADLEDLEEREIVIQKKIREISGNNTETRQKNRKELEDKTHNPEENDEN
jgi:CRISPR/Cas system CMR subunit Cmr4 (Cas7 group RAMP superfamily)